MSELLDINQFTNLLGISVDTAYYWRQVGKGPKAARIGKQLRYRKSDVDAWLDTQFAQ